MDAADHLVKKCGADKVYIIATHGVLSGDAIKKIQACDSVYKVILKCSFNKANPFIYIYIYTIYFYFLYNLPFLLLLLFFIIVGCYQYLPYSQRKE